MAEACKLAVTEYLAGGDDTDDPFGGADPFELVDGGTDSIADGFVAVTVNIAEYPVDDSRYSAFRLGRLQARSAAPATTCTALDTYMYLLRSDQYAEYTKGVTTGKKEAEEMRETIKSSVTIPTLAEAKAIEAEFGMAWSEGTALVATMFSGRVPTATEVNGWGWGHDPRNTEAFKNRKKFGTITHFELVEGSAEKYINRFRKLANELRKARWYIAASTLTEFTSRLSSLTLEQGRGDLFIEYMRAHMDDTQLRCKPPRADYPLDRDLVEQYVIGVRGGPTVTGNGKSISSSGAAAPQGAGLGDEMAAMRLQREEDMKAFKDAKREISSLQSELAKLKNKVTDGDDGKKKMGCWICKSTEHYSVDCPQNKKNLPHGDAKPSTSTDV